MRARVPSNRTQIPGIAIEEVDGKAEPELVDRELQDLQVPPDEHLLDPGPDLVPALAEAGQHLFVGPGAGRRVVEGVMDLLFAAREEGAVRLLVVADHDDVVEPAALEDVDALRGDGR